MLTGVPVGSLLLALALCPQPVPRPGGQGLGTCSSVLGVRDSFPGPPWLRVKNCHAQPHRCRSAGGLALMSLTLQDPEGGWASLDCLIHACTSSAPCRVNGTRVKREKVLDVCAERAPVTRSPSPWPTGGSCAECQLLWAPHVSLQLEIAVGSGALGSRMGTPWSWGASWAQILVLLIAKRSLLRLSFLVLNEGDV